MSDPKTLDPLSGICNKSKMTGSTPRGLAAQSGVVVVGKNTGGEITFAMFYLYAYLTDYPGVVNHFPAAEYRTWLIKKGAIEPSFFKTVLSEFQERISGRSSYVKGPFPAAKLIYREYDKEKPYHMLAVRGTSRYPWDERFWNYRAGRAVLRRNYANKRIPSRKVRWVEAISFCFWKTD